MDGELMQASPLHDLNTMLEDQAFQFRDANTTLNLNPIEPESFRRSMSDTDDEDEQEWDLQRTH